MNDIDEVNEYGYTKLTTHVINGDYENVKALIEQGANLDILKHDKYASALTTSIIHQYTNISLLLIERGANVNLQNYHGLTPLIIAIGYKQVKVALTIIDTESVDLNIQDNANYTALIWAAVESWKDKEDCISIVTALINKNVDIELKDKYGLTALMNAAENNNIEIVKLLIDNGANINTQDYRNGTALIRAILNHCIDIAEHLINSGANLDIQNSQGYTALIWSAKCGEDRIVKLLIEKGAKVDTQDNEGNTALMYAVLKNHYNSIKYIIAANADLNIKNMYNNTALTDAVYNNNIVTTTMIIDAVMGTLPEFTDYSLDYHAINTFSNKSDVFSILLSIPFNTRPSIVSQLKRVLTHVYRQLMFHELNRINLLSVDVINKIVYFLNE